MDQKDTRPGTVISASFQVVEEGMPDKHCKMPMRDVGEPIKIDHACTTTPGSLMKELKSRLLGRKIRPYSLMISLHDSSVTVAFADGEKLCRLVDAGDEGACYIPWKSWPVLPGATVYLIQDCSDCRQRLVSTTVCSFVSDLCQTCEEDAAEEQKESRMHGRIGVLNVSDDIREPHPIASIHVTRWNDRHPPQRLAEAIEQTLADLHMRCPYETHDVTRTLNWVRTHPLHRFDLHPFAERLAELLRS